MEREKIASSSFHAGVLYVVATPIGNLEDITLRALRILKEVDLIAAEDTRRTRKLLTHYGISTSLTSYYDQIEASKAPLLIEQLKVGKTIALVTDAGTAGISDPGYRLVSSAWESGIKVVPIPGPSALTALLSCAGLPTDRFAFEGFLPAKKGRRVKALEKLKNEERTLVFFEPAPRLIACLEDIRSVFGDREAAIGRELTKIYEEILRGKLSELIGSLQEREVRGEVTLLVAGQKETEKVEEGLLAEEIETLQAQGLSRKEIAHLIGEKRGIAKRIVYAASLRL